MSDLKNILSGIAAFQARLIPVYAPFMPVTTIVWMMKIRTRKPAASTESGKVIQSDIVRQRYIAAQVARNPPGTGKESQRNPEIGAAVTS
jgi:hypothetical protein